MRQAAALLEPVIEVRDVLESFLADRILLDDWQQALSDASNRFTELGTRWSDERVTSLGMRVDALAKRGLETQEALTRSVASEVAEFLDEARVPGLPRPGDRDLGF